MARLQILNLPGDAFALIIDEAETLDPRELETLSERGSQIVRDTGARHLLVFQTTVDVI